MAHSGTLAALLFGAALGASAVIAQTSRALNVGEDYDFAIEAFNENGVSVPSAPVHLP